MWRESGAKPTPSALCEIVSGDEADVKPGTL